MQDVEESAIKVQVCYFAFDLLYWNGESLIEQSLEERRDCLRASFTEAASTFHFATFANPSSVDDIQALLDESIRAGCEGLMVKTLRAESSYEPSRRSRKWLKVKKDYIDGLGDSLDLVVIGGYAGRGKRTGVYGGYLLACYDPDGEEYQAICKVCRRCRPAARLVTRIAGCASITAICTPLDWHGLFRGRPGGALCTAQGAHHPDAKGILPMQRGHPSRRLV